LELFTSFSDRLRLRWTGILHLTSKARFCSIASGPVEQQLISAALMRGFDMFNVINARCAVLDPVPSSNQDMRAE